MLDQQPVTPVSRRAECSCGQLSATCAGEPIRVSVCHCLACKRRTGSAFSYNARYARANVAVEGREATFTRIGDEEGNRITYSFCPDCGSTVHYVMSDSPDTVAIPAGAFADMAFPPPAVSVFHASRCYDWVEIKGDSLRKRG